MPLSITIRTHVIVTTPIGSRTKRLVRNTTAWSTLVLTGNARSSKTNGAPSQRFDHHHPLSTVLLLCIKKREASPEKTKGV